MTRRASSLLARPRFLLALSLFAWIGFTAFTVLHNSNRFLSFEPTISSTVSSSTKLENALPSARIYHESSPGTNPEIKRVLIVGAGAAGLTAAKRLLLASPNTRVEVHILEASSAFGGRVQKDTSGFATDYDLDLGASWVYDPKRLPLMALNLTLELRHQTQTPASSTFTAFRIHSDGQHTNYHLDQDTNHLWVDYSWYDFLKEHIYQPALEAGLKVHYNCPVTSIQQQHANHGYQILVQSACGQFGADHVIVTASLAVLQANDITFSPSLSPKVVRKLHKRKMWPGFKIFLEFSHKFYPDFFYWMPNDGEVDFWDYGLVMPHSSQHILAGYYIGEPYFNKFDEDMTPEEIVQVVLRDLDEAFGDDNHHQPAIQHLLQYKIINWSHQPYIRGVYCNKPVTRRGPLPVWPSAQLLLAGEAFPIPPGHNGWVDGASLSGLHAADLVLKEMNPQRRFTIPQELLLEE